MSSLNEHFVVVPLLRYSDGQKQNNTSNESQLAEIQEYLAATGNVVKIPFVIEAAHSGRDRHRKQLESAYKKIKRYNQAATRPITLLLMLKWDRWFRNALASVEQVIKFNDIGVLVNSAKEWVRYGTGKDLLEFFTYQSMAQNYSDGLSEHTIRNQKGCLRRGYNPYKMGKYFNRERDHNGLKQNKWADISTNLRNAGIMIINGATIVSAWEATGGREVHGSLQAFKDTLKNEKVQARHGEYQLNYPPLWSELEWVNLQATLKDKRVITRAEKKLRDAYLCGIIRGCCGKRASRETIRKKNRKGKVTSTHKYYICTCKVDGRRVNHYRYKRKDANSDFIEMIKEIGLSANRQKQLSAKAKKRSEDQLKHLKRERDQLEKRHEEDAIICKRAKRLLLLGEITVDDRNEVEQDRRETVAKLEELNGQIEKYGQILESVIDDISKIGTFLSESADYLQLRDFTKMLFPDGLYYSPEKRQFRTTSMNAAYCLIDTESVSYNRIKLGVADNEPTTPVMGGRPEVNRTPRSDLQLYAAYCYKYKVA